MIHAKSKREARLRRQRRVRRKVAGDTGRPRLAVYRSNRHVYAQLIDDASGHTLAAASSREPELSGADGDKKAVARAVGAAIARRATDAGIERAVFDRGGRLYHGRVRSVAEAAREEGLRL